MFLVRAVSLCSMWGCVRGSTLDVSTWEPRSCSVMCWYEHRSFLIRDEKAICEYCRVSPLAWSWQLRGRASGIARQIASACQRWDTHAL